MFFISLYRAQKNPAHYGLDQTSNIAATAVGTEKTASSPHFDTLLEGLSIK